MRTIELSKSITQNLLQIRHLCLFEEHLDHLRCHRPHELSVAVLKPRNLRASDKFRVSLLGFSADSCSSGIKAGIGRLDLTKRRLT
uniref:CSON006957 protein n=1 Tax=Culicoides sonorensis TaxID=179676 RepID=A0A336MTB8_CULSO